MKWIWVHCPVHGGRPDQRHPLCQVAALTNRQQIKRLPRHVRPTDIRLSTREIRAAKGVWK